MNEKGENIVGVCIIILILCFFVGTFIQISLSHERVTIQGKVINAEYNEEYEYLEVTFDSHNETYRINKFGYDANVDFTVNSKLIIKLYKNDIWFLPNVHDLWAVREVIKVPGD